MAKPSPKTDPNAKGIAVICKNPLCMRWIVVPSGFSIETGSFKLKCPHCKRENMYRRSDVHDAVGPDGVALNPV